MCVVYLGNHNLNACVVSVFEGLLTCEVVLLLV